MGETQRLKLIVSYDGKDFAGWQSQLHGNTIQDQLEHALARICQEEIAVVGAGRTDAGVHALGQCAHVDVPAERLTAANWLKALNATLPLTIRILRARFVSAAFHARFSARAKLYRYRIINSSVLPPLEVGRAWHVTRPLNMIRLKKAATLFLGEHDFAGFAANRGKVETDTWRTMTSARVIDRGDLVAIEFSGDGFLYKMVRMMVGALVRCAMGKESLEAITLRLENTSRVDSGSALVPSAGEGVSPSRNFPGMWPAGKDRFGETPKPAPGTGALPELRGTIPSKNATHGIHHRQAPEADAPPVRRSAPRFVAPAEGLYLVRVFY